MEKEKVIEKSITYKVSKKEFLKALGINPEEVNGMNMNGSFDLDKPILIYMK